MDELVNTEPTETADEDKKITSEESGDIIDMVREKHENAYERSEHFGDILVMQITLCIILLLILVTANMIKPGLAHNFVSRFREMTSGEPEEILEKAVDKAIRIING